jgi:hypothetical protein
MIDITKSLIYLRPSQEWILDGDSYEGLVWLSDTPKPTEKELVEAYPAAQQAAVDAEAVKVAARESAMAKLAKLGLTIDEINAITP